MAFAFVGFGVRLASAQGVGALSGRVVEVDTDDYGVPGVTVRVVGTTRTAVTDQRGAFTLLNVPEGAVTLSATAPKYRATQLKVSASARKKPIVLLIKWESTKTASVKIVARKVKAQTTSTTRLKSRDMTSAPRRNAEEILRQVPGLTLVQHGSEGKGHQFFLRGFDAVHGADLELTLDGIMLNEWSNIHAQGYLDLGIIIPEMLQGVVVTKGPFTPEQGTFAMMGTAAYQLGVPQSDLGKRLAYTIGTTNRHRLFLGYAPASAEGQEFFGLETTYDDGFGVNRGLARSTFNGRTELARFDHGGRLVLTGLGGYTSFELPGTLRNDEVQAGVVDFYDTYDPRANGQSARGLMSLKYTLDDGPRTYMVMGYGGYRRLDLLENFTGYLIYPVKGDRRQQKQETWSFGLQAAHTSVLAESLSLRAGLGVRGDVFSQREDNVDGDLNVFANRRAMNGVQVASHLHAALSWVPVKRLRVDAGARLDMINVNVTDQLTDEGQGTLFVASPRLIANWRALDTLHFSAAYGRGLRPPEARAFTGFDAERQGIGEEQANAGQPQMTVSDAFELGSRLALTRWFGLNLTGFATFIERESIFDHVSGLSLELNGTRRLGGELLVYAEPWSWLRLSADATFVDARFRESNELVPFAPRFVGGVRAVVTQARGFRAGLRLLAIAPRPLPYNATGATMVMVDATLGYHWERLRLGLEVENLLNRQQREGEYNYASHWRPGRPGSDLPVIHTTAGAPLNARLTLEAVF